MVDPSVRGGDFWWPNTGTSGGHQLGRQPAITGDSFMPRTMRHGGSPPSCSPASSTPPGPGRTADPVGVVPRGRRVDRGRHRRHRGTDRAVRPGVPRPRPRPLDHRCGGGCRRESELRRRRHLRRCRHLRQTLFRPAIRWNPYRTVTPGVYLCSAAMPPGAGVHGMCGMRCRTTVLADLNPRG